MDSKIVQVALSGLENILKVGRQDSQQLDGVNQFAVMVEEAYGEISFSFPHPKCLSPRNFYHLVLCWTPCSLVAEKMGVGT